MVGDDVETSRASPRSWELAAREGAEALEC